MIYVLSGTNWFGIKQRLDGIKSEFVKKYGDLAVESIDGEEVGFEQIEFALDSLPFLSDKKLVIISRLAKNKAASEKIEELVKNLTDSAIAVIVEPEIDKRSVYYKTLKKMPGFEEYGEHDEYESVKWLVDQAEQKGGQLSRTDAAKIIDLAGNNQQKLAGELEKLLAYSPKITDQTIRLLVDPAPQSSIFNLLDAAFAGDLDSTLRLYEDQRAQGAEPLKILGMLTWQLHAVTLVQSAKGKSTEQISEQSGVKPFVLQKSRQISGRLDKARLQKLIDDLLKLDIKFKTTAINQDNALKNLLATLG
ncbi:DNA polymerase III subunit delta [Candidatus Parcubacteria bacterium]|nr:DNA polymerase III subunit delta [Candidatus Parcubacteria bacterium]